MITVFLLLSVLHLSSAANILAVIPSPSFSHQSTYWPIWQQLSSKGHQVTLLTTNPMENKTLTNLTEHNFHEVYKYVDKVMDVYDTADMLTLVKSYVQLARDVLEHFFESEVVQSLLKNNSSKRYDVVIVEDLFPEFLILGKVYNCPTILVHSTDTLTSIHTAMGNSIHPVVYSEKIYACSGSMLQTFWDRLGSTLYFLFTYTFRYVYTHPIRNSILAKYIGKDAPTVEELLDQADMLFLNINPILHGVKLLGGSTVTFAGGVHLRPQKPLTKDLQEYLDRGEKGVIYFSLGSSIPSSLLDKEKKKIIMETLGELPYSVLWKYEKDDLKDIPNNIKIIKWAPQQDILRHPHLKLFITHGGQQSVEEAILNGVPMVLLPFGSDQIPNARKIECEGLGKYVHHRPQLQKEPFKNAIVEVIENDRYRQKVKDFAKLLLDEPMPGVEKVIWWTEYVIRHRGAKHLRNPSLDVPLYQYLMLDVIASLIAVFTVVILMSCMLFKRLMKCKDKKTKVKSN